MSFREGHYFSFDENKNYTGGENNHPEIQISEYTSEELSKLWLKTLKKGMHGICFSMYENHQKPGDVIYGEQVNRRIQILKPYAKWVRSFSCIEGNEHIPRIAHQNGMKTLVGAWLGNDLEKNEIEIEALNQGESGPNTAQFAVQDEFGNVIMSDIWNLATGAKASLIVVKE